MKDEAVKTHTDGIVIKERISSQQEQDIMDWLHRGMIQLPIEDLRAQAARIKQLMSYYRCAMLEVETKFKVLDEEFSMLYARNPIETIKARIKSVDSIVRKLQSRGLSFNADSIERELNDVAGIRVICSFPEDVYKLADALLKQDDITLIQRKDYIDSPKDNGYRSLHLIVQVPIFLAEEKRLMRVEVQLRTIAMDFWASLEHQMKYKKNIPAHKVTDLTAELKQCAEQSALLDKKMEEIRHRIQEFN